MPRLIHLNGAPGSGKSTVAARWASDRPGALVVEVDQLRVQLDGWQTDESSKLLARELAIGLVGAHLSTGEDVIVPQYLGQLPFIERLSGVADAHGAAFTEVLVAVDEATAIERFTARNSERAAGSPDHSAMHPASDVDDAEAPALIGDAIARLEVVATSRGGIVRIDGTESVDDVVTSLCEALGTSQ